MVKEEININLAFSEIGKRKLALFGSSYLGNDLYYLKEFIDLMIPIFTEEKLVEMLKKDESKRFREIGENWDGPGGMKNNLKKMDKLIEETKAIYDLLEDKTLSKKDSKNYSLFMKKAKKITPLKQDIFDLFVFLVENSTLKRHTISSHMWKILEHKDTNTPLGLNEGFRG